jgi:Ca2+-binding RTX toxin-like protein
VALVRAQSGYRGASRPGGSTIRRSAVIIAIGLAGVFAAFAFAGRARATAPAIQSLTSNTYQSVTVTFGEPVFTTTASGAGSGDLVASDFSVVNTTCAGPAPAITAVTKVSQTVWTLTLDKDACPHDATINVSAGAVFNAGAEPAAAQAVAVPLSTAHLASLLSAFTGIDVPLDSFDAPLVGDWFEHKVADVVTARDITDLIPGLSAVTTASETQLANALKALPGITDVTFTGTGATLTFTSTDLGTANAFHQAGTVGIPGADFQLSGTVDGKLAFGGTLGLAITPSGAQVIDPAGNLSLAVNVSGTIPSMTGRLGFVDVTAAGTTMTMAGTLAVDLDCPTAAPSCAPADLVKTVTPGGTAQLSIPSVSIARGNGSPLVIGDGSPDVVDVTWALPDLASPTVTSAFDTYHLTNFSEVSFQEVLAGLKFVSSWLTEVEHYNAMAVDVPVIGGTLGDLTQTSARMKTKLDSLVATVATLTEDPSAQKAVRLLCNAQLLPLTASQCATALDPLKITSDTIEYQFSLDLPATLFGPGGIFPAPTVDLALGDDFKGIALSAQTGTWTGTSTISVDFTLGLKIGSNAEIATELGYNTPGDLDEDGIPDATDTDDDGDGVPESDTLANGDLCKGLAASLHLSSDDLRHVNGDITDAQCDAKVAVGASIATEPSDATPEVLTAETACLAVAQVHGIGATPFMDMNHYASAAACAAAVSSTGTFVYDDHVTPVSVANRIYVKAGDDPIIDANLHIAGTGVGVGATLGFLDLGVTGSVSLNPGVEVKLDDPKTSADDHKIDLAELAKAADDHHLGDLVKLDLSGAVEAHFTLTNSLVPSLSADLDVVGDVSAFDNPVADRFEFSHHALDSLSDGDVHDDVINVGQTLGDMLNVKDLSPADAVRLVLDFAGQMGALAGDDAMNTEIPFVGMTVQDMLSFTRSLTDTAEAVAARDPQTLGALGTAMNDALQSQGFPAGLTIGVTSDELTIGFDASRSIDASYPFNLDLSQFGVDIPLLQVDGGATLSAEASIDYHPEVGILFDGTNVSDRLFVRDATPTFHASADATVNGAISLGPLSTAINGDLSLDATVAVALNDHADANNDGRFSVKELRNGFTAGDLINAEFSGPFSAHLEITTPEAHVNIDGDLAHPGDATIDHDIDLSSIHLDLGTLVTGATESAKFIGRTLQESDALSTDIPLLGDQLTGLVSVGQDIEGVAAEIRDMWDTAAANSESFLGGLESDLESYLCAGGDCVTLTLTDSDGDPTTELGHAAGILVNFTLAHEETVSTTLAGGIDLAPVFELDASLSPTVTYGYRMQVGFGLSIADGFYLQGGDVLEVYAKFATGNTINVPVKVGGMSVAGIVDGSATIGGSAGPDDDAAGFTVSLPPKLSYRDLANRRKSPDNIIEARFSLNAALDLPIDTTFTNAPNLHIPVKFGWNVDASLSEGVDIGKPTLTLGDASDPIQLDAQSFVSNVVAPILEQANTYNPLSQVPQIKQTLDTQIPVLDSTVRELVRLAVGNQPSWKVFEFLVDMDSIVDQLSAPGAGMIEVGWVEVIPTYHLHPSLTPWWQRGAGASLADVLDNLNRLSGGTGTFKTTTPPPPSTPASPAKMFSFPILEDPMKAVGMILGGDFSEPVSFIEFRAPPLNIGPQIHWSQTLFDLNIGFVSGSISLQVDGFIGLEVRLGFGYDSTGLQPGRSPLDGVYLVDFKDGQRDLQEVAVGGRVSGTINGRFAIAGDLASANFRGSAGVNLTAGIDFNDESIAIPVAERGDGKFHLYEIAQVATASIIPGQPKELAMLLCPFRPAVNFSAFLQLSAKAKVLGITVFDESYSNNWTLVDWALQCQLETKIAKLVDGRLILNAGPQHAADRFDGEGDVAEGFNLTLVDGGSNIQVAWTGAGSKPSLKFPTDKVNEIYGDLGAGADHVAISSAITKPATLIGGAAGDTLEGGGGPDAIQGNAGDDALTGGPGADALDGGDGNDAITPGAGDDTLAGGDGNDSYTFAAGWGHDSLDDAVGTETVSFASVTQALTGTSSFGEATITDGTNSLGYLADQVDILHSGNGADTYTLAPDMPNGFALDTAGGADTVNAPMSGQTRTIRVTDTGAESTDRLKVFGTPGRDTFLLRAKSTDLTTLPTEGFVAMLAPGSLVDRINYDHSLDALELDTGAGRDKVALDDVAVPATLRGAEGADTFQVGQVFEHPRDVAHGIAAADVFATASTTRGRLSKGISYAATIDGGTEGDLFNVFSNKGVLTLQGGDGDDTFVLRAFVEAGSLTMSGDAGADHFQVEDFSYVDNQLVNIDGGAGADTVVLVGTELNDGFLVSSNGLKICKIAAATSLPNPSDCAVTASYVNIESVLGQGLEGDDVFQVLSTAPAVSTALFGSENSDTFVVGNAGDVTGVQGPLRVSGEADPNFDEAIPAPVVLPGENANGAVEPTVTSGTNVGDTLRVDASANASGNTGNMRATDVTGLGMGSTGVVYAQMEFVTVQLDGEADTFNVLSTHSVNQAAGTVRTQVLGGGGRDTINVQAVSDTTRIDGEAGDDTVNVGSLAPSTAGTVHGIDALLDVVGGDGTNDRVFVDDTGDSTDNTLRSVQGRITGLGLSSEGITHGTIELLDVSFGAGNDVTNMRGTSTATVVHGNGGDERFYVSDAADFGPHSSTDHLLGTLDDIDGAVTFDAGSGRHLLMVSDESATIGDGTLTARAVIDEHSITGLSTGAINYGATGTYAGGITVWTSKGADALRIEGSRRDGGVRTVTTVNTNEGADNVMTTLDAGTDGFVDVNLEEGDDALDAAGHSLPLVVFGGTGLDSITTGTGADTVLGDVGLVEYGSAVTVLGGGGPGDKTDGIERDISAVRTVGTIGAGDTIATSDGNDWVMGQQGSDTVNGGAGDDGIIGGHNAAGGSDAGDTLRGGAGNDEIAGDNAVLWPGTVTRLLDVATLTSPAVTSTFGPDVIAGDGDDDTLFGQGGSDRIFGGDGLDSIEGNHADDCLMGGAGQDNIVGGGSAANGTMSPTRTGTGLLDGVDTIYGDGAEPTDSSCVPATNAPGSADVIAGDNARVLWVMSGASRMINAFDGSFARGVLLFDVERPSAVADPNVHGADAVYAGDGNDWVFGQGDADALNGDGGDDTIEGNHGADTINGGAGQDDIVGGSSAGGGAIKGTVAPTGLSDGVDTIHGNDGADVVLADNGVITRAVNGNGTWRTLGNQNGNFNAEFQVIVVRTTSIATGPEMAGAFGNDTIYGDAGADEIIGQQGADYIEGNDGSDAIVGDLGRITTTLESGARAATPKGNAPFLTSNVYQAGTLTRQVELFSFLDANGAAGADILLGGAGTDAIHGGPGADVMNGNAGDDYLFGGAGNDAMWGGPGNDDEFGGYGNDYLDVFPRPVDPQVWKTYGSVDHMQGYDLLYGGFDSDAMQADFQQNGPGIADRLVDWAGTYNAYLVCNGGGAGTIIRSVDPATIAYLQAVAEGRGAFQVKTPTTSAGFNEAGIVFTGDVNKNTNPAHADGRGQGVCPP